MNPVPELLVNQVPELLVNPVPELLVNPVPDLLVNPVPELHADQRGLWRPATRRASREAARTLPTSERKRHLGGAEAGAGPGEVG